MSSYTKSTDFASKDALLTGNPLKVVKGTEIDDEFNAIQTAVNSKADTNSPDLTGTPTAPTAAAATNTTQIASTAYVKTNITSGGNVTRDGIAADAINGSKIANDSINSEHYVDGSIDNAHLANGVVTNAKLANDAVTGAKIANDSINSEHYVDGSIDSAHLANNSINSQHYVDGSIDRVHLANDIIDGTKIANDVINSEHYVAGSIDAEHLASDSVTSAKIANSVALGGNPTTTTQAVSNRSTRIATTDFVRDAIDNYVDNGTFNDGVSGYLILPNGLKMAWGRTSQLSFSGGAYSQGSRAEETDSLPTSFSAVYHAQATTLTSNNIYAGVESLSTSSIRVWARCHQDVGSYSAYVYWLVIGE